VNLNSDDIFLEKVLKTLIDRFNIDSVQNAFDQLKNTSNNEVSPPQKDKKDKPKRVKRNSVLEIIDSLKESDINKHNTLTDFYKKLKSNMVLREAEDIRYFSHIIGMKEISGKSRNELVSSLIRFLSTINLSELIEMIKKSENISSNQRQSGFGILTDRLLRDN